MKFLASGLLAVYEVQTNQQFSLKQRDQSGGAGKFILEVRILNADNHSEVKALHLITSDAEESSVFPVGSKLLVRTGNLLHLYSANFEEIVTRQLPTVHTPDQRQDHWSLNVSLSGKTIYAERDSTANHHWSVEGAFIDPDTLSLGALFDTRGKHLLLADDSLLLTLNDFGDTFGQFLRDGTWQPLFRFQRPNGDPSCSGGLSILNSSPSQVAVFRCNTLNILSLSGDLYSSIQLSKREEFTSFVSAGSWISAEVSERLHDPLDSGIRSKPKEIILYDLSNKTLKWTIPINQSRPSACFRFYDVSSAGTIAFIEGTTLKLYD